MTLLTPPQAEPNHEQELRRGCHGDLPLTARLQPWMVQTLNSGNIDRLVEQFGSPLNLQCVEPFTAAVEQLRSVGTDHGVRLDPFFARKANKCLVYVDACREVGCGVDTASEAEVQQTLDRGIPAEQVVCTAAIKEPSLIELCVRSGVTIVLDNPDEARLVARLSHSLGAKPRVSLRLNGFRHEGRRLDSRFGFPIESLEHELSEGCLTPNSTLEIAGVHFHLDGYNPEQRISAIRQCLPLINHLRAAGHNIEHLDIGGGLPVCYLESRAEWDRFWALHKQRLLKGTPPLTYRGNGLGLTEHGGELIGAPQCYPFFQQPERDAWLDLVLSATADGIRSRNLRLRCEPGRALLDGCGMTIARVAHRRRQPDGDWHVGLAMNSTQCRTGSVDMLVDPLHVPAGFDRGDAEQVTAGFLTGAYCTESEAILLRRLRFPHGVAVGDLFAFPNTAGYFMHFRECRSHQFPLAKNLVVSPNGGPPTLDAIDQL